MADIVPFPLIRRRRLIARLRQSKPGELRHYLRVQARMLERAGIDGDEIAAQLRALCVAVQCGGNPHRSHTPGGAA
jgi:hypothetical protein